MTLSPEAVDAYKTILQNPNSYGFDFKPLSEALVKSETITAQHILYKDYIDYIQNGNLPKVMFYIIIQDIYGICPGKDADGNAGYYLKVDGKAK